MSDVVFHKEPTTPAQVAHRSPEPMTFNQISNIIARRQRVVVTCIMFGLIAGIAAVLTSKQMYLATSTVELLKQPSLAALTPSSAPDTTSSDALSFNLTLQTDVNLLRSARVASRVIQDLDLENSTPEFRFSRRESPLSAKEKSGPLALSPRRQQHALRSFNKHLKIDPVAGTRLIAVSYEDPDPVLAAQVVNHVVQAFVQDKSQLGSQTASKADDWLQGQLSGMKTDVELSQARVAALQKRSGIFGLDELHNVVTARLEQLNTALANADASLVSKAAIARAASSGNPDLVAGLVNTGSGSNGINPTLVLLQSLRAQESEAETTLTALTSQFGPNYPRVIEARQRLATVRATAYAEVVKMRARAQAEYEVAKSVRDAAQGALDAQKVDATALSSRAVDYSLAKREADSKEALYQQLRGKLTEAQAFAGLSLSDVNVVDQALVPDKPSNPAVPLYIGAATVAGALLGLLLTFILDTLDASVRDPDELEHTTGATLLALLPKGSGKVAALGLVGLTGEHRSDRFYANVVLMPDSRLGESFRSLRVALFERGKLQKAQVIAITSSLPGEGKSFTILNLASVLAQSDKRVLIIDADVRHGKVSEALGMGGNEYGLTSILSDKADGLTRPWQLSPGVTVLPRGPEIANPTAVVSSAQMASLIQAERANYDFILVTTPPLLPVADAVVVSHLADLTLVIVRFGKTPKAAIQQSIRLLSQEHGKDVGFILNGMDPKGPDFVARVGTGEYVYVAR